MKNLVPLLVFFAFCGCREISFKEPQPKGKKSLREVPEKLLGKYLLQEEKDTAKDTLVVTRQGYLIVSDRKQSLLGDSLVLKRYKGYYFLSINENPEWILRIIKREKNGDLTYMSMDEEDRAFKDLVNDLAREVGIDSVKIDDKMLYQIDPSPRQLINLIKKGYFKKTILMQRLE
ncbi:MAG: hypothetical protein OEV74_18240 [Cyclobacteriaceae bacterium]|nr:hypothetical protein [Cyclobacteriaceae bacterium]MDH4298223.1 hypothetical protein [Cyclobacteriaceae bacterium]MDH5249723.1 hypothetical protein [Cyclobacteriaceae bacterium]